MINSNGLRLSNNYISLCGLCICSKYLLQFPAWLCVYMYFRTNNIVKCRTTGHRLPIHVLEKRDLKRLCCQRSSQALSSSIITWTLTNILRPLSQLLPPLQNSDYAACLEQGQVGDPLARSALWDLYTSQVKISSNDHSDILVGLDFDLLESWGLKHMISKFVSKLIFDNPVIKKIRLHYA